MTVLICAANDRECGDHPKWWCKECPKRKPNPSATSWIKTSERLPIIGEEVLICVSRLIHDVAFLEDDGLWHDIYGNLLYATIESVDYWLELPPLPEEK